MESEKQILNGNKNAFQSGKCVKNTIWVFIQCHNLSAHFVDERHYEYMYVCMFTFARKL